MAVKGQVAPPRKLFPNWHIRRILIVDWSDVVQTSQSKSLFRAGAIFLTASQNRDYNRSIGNFHPSNCSNSSEVFVEQHAQCKRKATLYILVRLPLQTLFRGQHITMLEHA